VRDDRLYLVHIAECIDRIVRYTAEGKQAFLNDTRTQDAVLRNLHVLAESTQRISQELRLRHPEVAWRDIAAFRNVIVHGYLGVDLVRVWDIVARDLPVLHAQVLAMLAEGG
jgi:uncharacterized protein with HEPN domain